MLIVIKMAYVSLTLSRDSTTNPRMCSLISPPAVSESTFMVEVAPSYSGTSTNAEVVVEFNDIYNSPRNSVVDVLVVGE